MASSDGSCERSQSVETFLLGFKWFVVFFIIPSQLIGCCTHAFRNDLAEYCPHSVLEVQKDIFGPVSQSSLCF